MHETLRLIEAEIPRLRRFARYMARDPDLADDLVQECLLRAISRIESWQPGTNLRAWLLTILRNVFFTELRRVRRAPIDGDKTPEHVPAVGSPEGGQDFALYLAAVQQAFDHLSEEHREILLLVAVEELTYEEAASVLEIPIGTVRSRLSRARAALREALHDGSDKLEEGAA